MGHEGLPYRAAPVQGSEEGQGQEPGQGQGGGATEREEGGHGKQVEGQGREGAEMSQPEPGPEGEVAEGPNGKVGGEHGAEPPGRASRGAGRRQR